MAQELSPANLITLSGRQVHVTLSPSLTGRLQVSYQDARTQKMFTDDDVTREETTLGTLVSVTLSATPDLGSTTFTVLVPTLRLRGGAPTTVDTVGVTTIHRTSLAPALDEGQRETFTVTRLRGNASAVES